MRLKPEKVEHLARVITETLTANPEVKLGDSPDKVAGLIKQVILADLRSEDEIEEEARKLIEQHMQEINRTGASFEKILQKTKLKIARDRKMVL